jgi:hypothetical protein
LDHSAAFRVGFAAGEVLGGGRGGLTFGFGWLEVRGEDGFYFFVPHDGRLFFYLFVPKFKLLRLAFQLPSRFKSAGRWDGVLG